MHLNAEDGIKIDELTELAVDNIFEYLNKRFGENRELEEELKRMTKTLYDPAVELRGIEKGREEGIEKGIEKGEIKLLTKLLVKKFGILPADIIQKLSESSIEKLEAIGEAIFEISSIQELEGYLEE